MSIATESTDKIVHVQEDIISIVGDSKPSCVAREINGKTMYAPALDYDGRLIELNFINPMTSKARAVIESERAIGSLLKKELSSKGHTNGRLNSAFLHFAEGVKVSAVSDWIDYEYSLHVKDVA